MWLPLYVERSMKRSIMSGGGGDRIDFGFELRTLVGFWDDYSYMRPEQSPVIYLLLNLALAGAYAAVITLGIELLTRRLKK